MARRRARVLGMIMAGGKGERLQPLTRERSKPAVPFGARYRIIDFVLSNFVNSEHALALRAGAVQVAVADRAPARDLAHLGGLLPETFVTVVPPQMRFGRDLVSRHRRRRLPEPQPDATTSAPTWSRSSAPTTSTGWTSSQMLDFHLRVRADVTVAARPVPLAEASSFGVHRGRTPTAA